MINSTIDWKSIRILNGSQQEGFEELCSQLAENYVKDHVKFDRVGKPDAGVECYATFSDGSEWGWQAKYLFALGQKQLQEIDKSIKTALEKHPLLKKYYVCIPYDLPDARIANQKSAKEKWEIHKKKWEGWAQELEIKVEFIYWGNFELVNQLMEEKHRGRILYWFNHQYFSQEWFNEKIELSISAAGARYTPEINVKLPIAQIFEVFTRNQSQFTKIRIFGDSIKEKSGFLHYKQQNGVDKQLSDLYTNLYVEIQKVVQIINEIKFQPVGELPFNNLLDMLHALFSNLEKLRHQRDILVIENKENKSNHGFDDNGYSIIDLREELIEFIESLEYLNELMESRLLIVTGEAGTGKTHLLCDVAKTRIENNMPTLLLMGQQFTNSDEPYSQIRNILDIPGVSLQEFLQALETSAQMVNNRAIIVIDALNEGKGREIWPNHLSGFVEKINQFQWISVVFSVRSRYEGIIFPEDFLEKSFTTQHMGFAGHEYDAMKIFLKHYDIDYPSTPMLTPEYQNPLFLKILCESLKNNNEKKLPKGTQGIFTIFERYINAINNKLAKKYSYNPRRCKVSDALELIVRQIRTQKQNWLPIQEAEKLLSDEFTGLNGEDSFYQSLVFEGILTEYIAYDRDPKFEVCMVSYERFSDYLLVNQILNDHLDKSEPSDLFAENGPLEYITAGTRMTPGFLEALCVLIAERTGKELIEVSPSIQNQWQFTKSFFQSIIWRKSDAISPSTTKIIENLIKDKNHSTNIINTLLTLSTTQDSPINASYLHNLLINESMTKRDTWWSISIHELWNQKSTLDRLIEWPKIIQENNNPDNEVIYLGALIISWTFTSSNRFLRDKATKSLVLLLTGHIDILINLITEFRNVNDLYVLDRILAVAYGVAMRNSDNKLIGKLARTIYDLFFISNSPPPHILARDYARGIVEIAIHNRFISGIEINNIRPPYQSKWPSIPTKKEIRSIMPNKSKETFDSGDLVWAKRAIYYSVFDGDFARYIIGTNFHTTNWLSISIDEKEWAPPKTKDRLVDEFIANLNENEIEKWSQYILDSNLYEDEFTKLIKNIPDETLRTLDEKQIFAEILKIDNSTILDLEKNRNISWNKFYTSLSEQRISELAKIEESISTYEIKKDPPYFDLSIIQRYVYWRVFDLGWNIDNFGYFDRFMVDKNGRASAKAERIGKKYQWIAYHEIKAYIADHFQYRERFGDNPDTNYVGPWQERLRDIDSSYALEFLPGGTSWTNHGNGWWDTINFNNWSDTESGKWIDDYKDIPDLEKLLTVTNEQGKFWFNIHGHFHWERKKPEEIKESNYQRREYWLIFKSYIIKESESEKFFHWARNMDFLGDWMPEELSADHAFLGEYYWSPAYNYWKHIYKSDYLINTEWSQPNRYDCPINFCPTTNSYLWEQGGYDCSLTDSIKLSLPSNILINGISLRWNGRFGTFENETNEIVAYDPTMFNEGPDSLLFSKTHMDSFLKKHNYSLCWIAFGAKELIGPGTSYENHFTLPVSGAYIYSKNKITGFLNVLHDDYRTGISEFPERIISTI